MSQISGVGGVQPPKRNKPPKKNVPVKDHIQLEGAKESLLMVLHALKHIAPPKGSKLYSDRLSELKKELKVLEKMAKLIKTKPKGYESKMKEYLLEGESVKGAEKTVPAEITRIHEKMRAVATAKILTQETD